MQPQCFDGPIKNLFAFAVDFGKKFDASRLLRRAFNLRIDFDFLAVLNFRSNGRRGDMGDREGEQLGIATELRIAVAGKMTDRRDERPGRGIVFSGFRNFRARK